MNNPVWLLRLIPPGRWGRWLAAGLIFGLLFILYVYAGGVFGESDQGPAIPGVALFFCIILAYIVPIFHLITERTQQAFQLIVPMLGADEDSIETWSLRIARKPRKWSAIVLLLGLTTGAIHNWLLWPPIDLPTLLTYAPGLLSIFSTMLVWLMMMTVIASLVDNALLFNKLGKQVEIDLLNTKLLTPFATVAVSSALALIGAQAAFPVLIYESEVNQLAFIPGMIMTGLPMVFMFFLPIWPVHRRLADAKRSEISRITSEIGMLPQRAADQSRNYDQLNPLLIFRREIGLVSEWPFDMTLMGRLMLYLIIPPLTWIGAAFIEILIDSAI